jgi:hypothetical protein
MNGWHAVSGFLIVVPVLIVLFKEELLPWVLAASAVALYGTAVWTVFSDRPAAGLFYFTQPTADIALHIFTGSIFALGAIVGFRSLKPALS